MTRATFAASNKLAVAAAVPEEKEGKWVFSPKGGGGGGKGYLYRPLLQRDSTPRTDEAALPCQPGSRSLERRQSGSLNLESLLVLLLVVVVVVQIKGDVRGAEAVEATATTNPLYVYVLS